MRILHVTIGTGKNKDTQFPPLPRRVGSIHLKNVCGNTAVKVGRQMLPLASGETISLTFAGFGAEVDWAKVSLDGEEEPSRVTCLIVGGDGYG